MHKYKVKFIVIFIAYSSLLLGFFLNENSSGGALNDFKHHYEVMLGFNIDFGYSLHNYHVYKNDHSPLFISTLLVIFNILGSEDLLRFVFFHFALFIPFFFYLCLKQIFKDVDSDKLFIFSFILILSPHVRSLSFWPGSEIISLLFFLLSIFFYSKFLDKHEIKYAYLNILFLALSSYYKPIYAVFSVLFFIEFIKVFGVSRKTLILALENIFLSVPAFYFILFINNYPFRLQQENESIYSFNISNIILIVSSIILFHFLFFIYYFINSKKLFLFKNIKLVEIILIAILTIILSLSFNFDVSQLGVGGGVFLKVSNLLFGNDIIFFVICFFSIIVIYSIIKLNFLLHLMIFLCLFLQNPLNYFYHEYYDPLFMILFFTLFSSKLSNDFFKEKTNIFSLYVFYSLFFMMNLFKNLNYFTNNIIF